MITKAGGIRRGLRKQRTRRDLLLADEDANRSYVLAGDSATVLNILAATGHDALGLIARATAYFRVAPPESYCN